MATSDPVQDPLTHKLTSKLEALSRVLQGGEVPADSQAFLKLLDAVRADVRRRATAAGGKKPGGRRTARTFSTSWAAAWTSARSLALSAMAAGCTGTSPLAAPSPGCCCIRASRPATRPVHARRGQGPRTPSVWQKRGRRQGVPRAARQGHGPNRAPQKHRRHATAQATPCRPGRAEDGDDLRDLCAEKYLAAKRAGWHQPALVRRLPDTGPAACA